MINHVWSVVCGQSITDRELNNISLINVIEQLNVAGTPPPGTQVQVALEVVTLWIRSDPDTPVQGRERVTIVSPSGAALHTTENEIDLSRHERVRQRTKIKGLPVEMTGRVIFRIELRVQEVWRQVAAIPVRVVLGQAGQ